MCRFCLHEAGSTVCVCVSLCSSHTLWSSVTCVSGACVRPRPGVSGAPTDSTACGLHACPMTSLQVAHTNRGTGLHWSDGFFLFCMTVQFEQIQPPVPQGGTTQVHSLCRHPADDATQRYAAPRGGGGRVQLSVEMMTFIHFYCFYTLFRFSRWTADLSSVKLQGQKKKKELLPQSVSQICGFMLN